jgi:hypothetical protein
MSVLQQRKQQGHTLFGYGAYTGSDYNPDMKAWREEQLCGIPVIKEYPARSCYETDGYFSEACRARQPVIEPPMNDYRNGSLDRRGTCCPLFMASPQDS